MVQIVTRIKNTKQEMCWRVATIIKQCTTFEENRGGHDHLDAIKDDHPNI